MKSNSEKEIGGILFHTWGNAGAALMGKKLKSISPLADFSLAIDNLPRIGLLSQFGRFTLLPEDLEITNVPRLAYFGISRIGLSAFCQALRFLTTQGGISLNFEHDSMNGGVHPMSYELEIVDKDSDMAISLLHF